MAKSQLYNFNAGPAILPRSVVEQVQQELPALPGVGLSILEISHRSADFTAIIEKAQNSIRKLYNLPDEFDVLFLQGGASLQFEMIPLNLLTEGDTAQYITTGNWGQKALKAAQASLPWSGGKAEEVYSDKENGFRHIPQEGDYEISPEARYVHFTSNETIQGVQWVSAPDAGKVPLVADISSDMLSRPIDFSPFAMLYGGAQKNLGAAGVTVVLLRRDFLKEHKSTFPPMLDYHTQLNKKSLYNTPNTFGIYVVSLVCDWLQEQGGLKAMAKINAQKATTLYDAIDNSGGFYAGHAAQDSCSVMNVAFRIQDQSLEAAFIQEATEAGFVGIKGHRDVGGLRASLYNALPQAAVTALVEFMAEFQRKNG